MEEEDDLLQFAIQQSLLDAGTEHDQVNIFQIQVFVHKSRLFIIGKLFFLRWIFGKLWRVKNRLVQRRPTCQPRKRNSYKGTQFVISNEQLHTFSFVHFDLYDFIQLCMFYLFKKHSERYKFVY